MRDRKENCYSSIRSPKNCKIYISNIKENFKKATLNIEDLTEWYENLIGNCTGLLKLFDGLHLRKLKPRVQELTDAGPGVGKSNRDIRFRAAEKVLIENLDFYSRRATGDCQNEVERTQSAVGKAISDDLISETCKDLARRVQNSAGPSRGFMIGLVSNTKDGMFFSDETSLKNYLDTAQTKRHMLPRYNYYKKNSDFYASHFEDGELYIEYVKFKCEEKNGTTCEYCTNGWSASPITVVPKPYPDENYKYKNYEETTMSDMNGKNANLMIFNQDAKSAHNLKMDF
ncbi:unnamed protein product [Mytilus coruscus]|uniref:Uncharacterized protein n=1 Tax=Mytilus coruscus TaxID=42192 RepID=A0A6J8F538_MYTCO|nr:unnamed protein product [Mytilus coruscus]